MQLQCGKQRLDLSTPLVMGILNVTPDSFSDGGLYSSPNSALDRALRMVDEGAGIIDVGGESTRPGATHISADEEISRVVPVVKALSGRISIPISVDTSRPEVIRAVADSGASIINDIRALREPNALEVLSRTELAVCLMHMQGEPKTMQSAPTYADVFEDVRQFLVNRVAACEKAGIGRERLLIDPGIGFGKSLEHNLTLVSRTESFLSIGLPILIGASRKSMLGAITGRSVHDRMASGLAIAAACVLRGAAIIRTHDVAPTVDAIKVAYALRKLEIGARQP